MLKGTGPSVPWKGFTDQLQTGEHLVAKLEYDFRRMEAEPLNVYPVFDFFITADHMSEWSGRGTGFRATDPLLELVFHLASGAKHFEATNPRHQSVKSVRAVAGGFQRDAFQADAIQVGGFVVERQSSARWAAGYIDSLSLAREVIAFWKSERKVT